MSWLWDRVAEATQAPPAVAPAREPDAQDLYGNAFLGGLFDPSEQPAVAEAGGIAEAAAAVHRIATAQQLREKFAVGDTPEEGKAWVSEEEFEAIVALHSDIALGRTTLTVEGDDEHRAAVMEDLAKLMQTPSGRELLDELAHDPRHAHRIVQQEGAPKTGHTFPGFDEKLPEDRQRLHDAQHNKEGSDSWVRYQPGQTHRSEKDGDIPSDVVLFHELVHAWHGSRGDNWPGSHEGIDNDEFQAVWYDRYNENRYRAERAADLGEDLDPRETYGGQKVPAH